jgi:hypothetical protein
MRYKGSLEAPSQIARELGADAVVRLLSCGPGKQFESPPVWSLPPASCRCGGKAMKGPDADVLLLQNEIAAAIASSVKQRYCALFQFRNDNPESALRRTRRT